MFEIGDNAPLHVLLLRSGYIFLSVTKLSGIKRTCCRRTAVRRCSEAREQHAGRARPLVRVPPSTGVLRWHGSLCCCRSLRRLAVVSVRALVRVAEGLRERGFAEAEEPLAKGVGRGSLGLVQRPVADALELAPGAKAFELGAVATRASLFLFSSLF